MISGYSNYKAEDLLLDDSFLRYCKGIVGDVVLWETRGEGYPDLEKEIRRAKKMYHLISVSVPEEEKKAAAGKLKLAIVAAPRPVLSITPPSQPFSLKKGRLLQYGAAAITVSVLLSVALWLHKSNIPTGSAATEFATAGYREVIASKDSRRQVQLPDGSMALLNYGSILKISANYNEMNRRVYLEGEAFFSVKPNADKPFVVITDKTATTALGTTFKVRNYPAEGRSNVMLATGKVKVEQLRGENSRPLLLLLPGEQATWHPGSTLVKAAFDVATLSDWQSMKIIFDNAQLNDIVKTLECYYGVQLVIQNKPATEIAFTGKFYQKSLKEVLEAISFTNKFRYTQQGNTVTILFQ